MLFWIRSSTFKRLNVGSCLQTPIIQLINLPTNAEYFSIFQDNKQTIEKWIGIKSVQLYDTHILIYGIEKFLIPAKSMKKDEYNSLKVLISEKLKIT